MTPQSPCIEDSIFLRFLLMGTILKVFTEFVTILLLFYILDFWS